MSRRGGPSRLYVMKRGDPCNPRGQLLASRLERGTAILPLGSLEWHCGAPMGTDTLIAEWLASALCEAVRRRGCNAIVLPTLYYGASSEWSGYAEVSVKRSTLAAVILDIAGSLERQGFQRFVIVNGHGGNSAAVRYAAETLVYDQGSTLEVYIVEWWRLLGAKLGHMDELEARLLAEAAGVEARVTCECRGLGNPYTHVECREAGEPRAGEKLLEKLAAEVDRLAASLCREKPGEPTTSSARRGS